MEKQPTQMRLAGYNIIESGTDSISQEEQIRAVPV